MPAPEAAEANTYVSPFTYERVDDPAQADLAYRRVPPIRTVGGEFTPLTDEQILERARQTVESKYWFLDPYWQEKGAPHEQVELQVGDHRIDIFNFNRELPLTEEHLAEISGAIETMAASFPRTVENCQSILIDDIQPPSALGDDELYPQNGDAAQKAHGVFVLNPRAMQTIPFRIPAVSNLRGTVTHELTHLDEAEFMPEWNEHFQWGSANAESGEWELRPAPSGVGDKWFSTRTGVMLPQGKFPLQPEQCVTTYGQQLPEEDLCDSVVAYHYDRARLEAVSGTKAGILAAHDASQEPPKVALYRVPTEQVALPTLDPTTVRYYIKEPAAA